mgnify:CR=1 FL=1
MRVYRNGDLMAAWNHASDQPTPSTITIDGNPLRTGFHDRYKADCTDGWLYGLQKICALEAYRPPEDTRTEAQRIRDMARANAMRAANRSARSRGLAFR